MVIDESHIPKLAFEQRDGDEDFASEDRGGGAVINVGNEASHMRQGLVGRDKCCLTHKLGELAVPDVVGVIRLVEEKFISPFHFAVTS